MTAQDPATKQVTDLFSKLTVATNTDERRAVAADLAKLVAQASDIHFLNKTNILDTIKADGEKLKVNGAREGAMLAIEALCQQVPGSDPYVLPLLPLILERYGDKVTSVRDAARAAGDAFTSRVSPHAVKKILPILYEAMINSIRWQSKLGGIEILRELVNKASKQVRLCLPDIMPHAVDAMWDTKAEVKQGAAEMTTELCRLVGNPDIEGFIPAMIQCIADPTQVPECVYKLAATTFVTQVEAPALAIMMPLLGRGLNEPNTAVKRQTAVIIENMCKLVMEPSEAEFFIPKLLPGLDRIIEIGADPELRSVAERARKTLLRAAGQETGNEVNESAEALRKVSAEENLIKMLKAIITEKAPKRAGELKDPFFMVTVDFCAALASELVEHRCLDEAEWVSSLSGYLAAFLDKNTAESISKAFVQKCIQSIEEEKKAHHVEEEEEGEDLCNCEFSLAYGGMILLNNTKLHLKRGRRYGLCGPNGVGKSTLMRAIANGQLDGFPPADVLKTVFVEHNLQAVDADTSVFDFVRKDDMTQDVPEAEVIQTFESVGFNDEMRAKAVGSLSGGWKMKLELARAMMVHADILLLDEPTNHLDVKNVKWLEDYLNSLDQVTSMIVSHDSGFLDHVCTDIIHYENRKLKRYKGNLSEFVKVFPAAQAYYALQDTKLNFKLPEPGFLDGVNTKDKAILKMNNVNFTYPGSSKPQLTNISVACSLSSRVGVLGPNGAGKSTMIKILTGEMVPKNADKCIYRHPALRICYVAQHAFHHLDRHLDKTANQYIQWRYQFGEDKELMEKESRQMTDADKKLLEQKVSFDGDKRQVEMIIGRRKLKKSYEYEIKWVGLPYEENAWISRDQMEQWGFNKLVQAFDDKEAAKQGMYARPLTAANVQKHLEDLGLEPEFSSHSFVRGLSGGQKVKVVIGASTWNQPHMLVLDEPSNYLDRDSLGALSSALKEFGGGVIIISHNSEFVNSICKEFWNMEDGKLTVSGQTTQVKEKIQQVELDETVDAFGNKIKLKSQKKLSKKEQRAKQRRKAAARARGEDVSSDGEEWPEDL